MIMHEIKRKITFALMLALLVLPFQSCKKNKDEIDELDRIKSFLRNNDLPDTPTEEGLYYYELISGSGDKPVDLDTVGVYYQGSFLSGGVFDYNYGSSEFFFTVGKGQVIEGWDLGIKYLKEGETAMLIIPSWLGYGMYGSYPTIPPSATLVFQIKLNTLIPGPNHVSR